jgi:poly(A) polymerase
MDELRPLGLQTWLRDERTIAVFDALGDVVGETARFVGGCVRNGLIGEDVLDIDVATVLLPDEVIKRLEAAGLKAIPTGLDHGTITGISSGAPYEITTLRKDVKTHGRHATVAYSRDWAEDASRRDFTINALYADRHGEVYDPLGGLGDLKSRKVCFIGEASDRIAEDYLRILRFFRIHAWYGSGELNKAGLEACGAAREMIATLSVERIRDELLKLLCAPEPLPVMRQMAATGVLGEILPEQLNIERFAKLAETDRISFFEPDGMLRLCALLEGDAEIGKAFGRRLKLSNADQARLRAAKEDEHRIFSYMSVREMRKVLYRIGSQTFQDRARILWAEDPKLSNAVSWRALIAMAATWERPQLPIGGRDVMRAGVPSGPEVGHILSEVEDWWVDADFIEDEFSLAERLKAIVQSTVF